MNKTETRINEIIEAAINEFLEKGYDQASMEKIALRAGLSKGGLYHHFNSKAEILFMVNQKFMEPIQGFLIKIENSNNLIKGLNQFIEDYINYWSTHKKELSLYFLTMNVSFSHKKIMELYQDSTHQIFSFFENQFQKGIKDKVFKEFDPYPHSVSLISCLDGFVGYMIINPTLPLKCIKKEIQNLFIENYLL